jgi:hypothetical protein
MPEIDKAAMEEIEAAFVRAMKALMQHYVAIYKLGITDDGHTANPLQQ